VIIALAGRRIDAADSKQPRFPLANVALVRERVRTMLKEQGATAVVCAAACGADLIALEEAGSLKLRRRVVLPFGRGRFRETSVIDRPGDWGPLYDQILNQVEEAKDLVVLKNMPDEEAYLAANLGILDEADALAKQRRERVKAALVWNGKSRGDQDITEEFGNEARKRGWPVVEVSTLNS
jgi:hypothetical protein